MDISKRIPSSLISSLDLGQAEFAQDPYSHYQELLQHGTIHWLEKQDAWLVLGFQDIQRVLQNPRAFSSKSDQPFDPILLNADAPEHSARRSSIAGTKGLFSNARIQNSYDQNRQIAHVLLDSFGPRVQADLIAEIAVPYSSMVMLNLLNLKPDSVDELMKWSQETVHSKALFDHDYAGHMWEKFKPQVQRMIERNLSEGLPLGLGEMLRDAQGLFPHDDAVIDLVKILLLGGHETTPNLVGSCLYRLLINDKFWLKEYREQRVDLDQIIRETLRFDAPTQLIHRTCTEGTRLGEIDINAGERLILSLGAANRDQAIFQDANSFFPNRVEKQILSFGFGPHYCLGAQLAMQETEILLGELLKRFPEMSLVEEDNPSFRPSSHIRGFQSLPIWLTHEGPECVSNINKTCREILDQELKAYGHWPCLERYPSEPNSAWTYSYPSPFVHANVLLNLLELGKHVPAEWTSQGLNYVYACQESGIWRFWPLHVARNPVPPDLDDLALCSLALKRAGQDPEHYQLIESLIRPDGTIPTWLWPNPNLLFHNWRLWFKLFRERGQIKPTIKADMLHPDDWELNVMLNVLAYLGKTNSTQSVINRCIELWENQSDPAHFYDNRWVSLYHFSRCYKFGIHEFGPLLNQAIPELESLLEQGSMESMVLGCMIAKHASLNGLVSKLQDALIQNHFRQSCRVEPFAYFTSKNRAYCGGSKSLTAVLLLQIFAKA